MICSECGAEMGDPVDKAFCKRRDSKYADCGEHTGDIYYCEICDDKYLHDFPHDEVVPWRV